MHIDILSPEQTLYQGDAKSITLPGIGGQFQILSNHAPMISALGKGKVIIEGENGVETYNIHRGFVEVLENKISVLVEHIHSEQE